MDGVFFSLQYFIPHELIEIGALSFVLLALARCSTWRSLALRQRPIGFPLRA